MPLYVLRFRIGPLPTTLLEILILATVGVYAAAVVAGQARWPRWTGFEIPIALLLLAGIIGVFVASDHRSALGAYRAYLLEPVALFYVAAAVLDLERAMQALLIAGALGALLFATLEIVTLLRSLLAGTLDIAHAAAALDINPNSVAIYLEPLIALGAAFWLFARGRTRLLSASLLLVLIAAEVSTLSRGGLLTLGVLGLIVLVSVRSWTIRLAVAATAVGGSIAAWQVTSIRLRILYMFSEQDNGPLFNRPHIWAATLRMLEDHPVFGAGINGYQTVMGPYRGNDPYNVPEPYAHNIFLSTWSELGLLGLAAFTWILGALLLRPWRAIRRASGIQVPLLWGTGVAYAMITAHGIVDTPYWKNDLSLEFWLLAAIQLVALRAVAAAGRD